MLRASVNANRTQAPVLLRLLATLALASPAIAVGIWIWLARGTGLGANPAAYLIQNSGDWAMVLLGCVLAVTPLAVLSKADLRQLVPLRRNCGLATFAFATLHLLLFAWLEHGFAWSSLAADIAGRIYLAVGFLAWVGLALLAGISNRISMRWLGRGWKALQRLIYVIAPLAVLHHFLARASKNDLFWPLVAAGVAAVLLLLRMLPAPRNAPGRQQGPTGS